MIQPGFNTLIMEALRYFATHGYTSEGALQDWLMRLHIVLERELPSDTWTRKQIGNALGVVFSREIKHGIQKRVPGVTRYTLDRVAPSLRAELDRRIFAGADLIRLNKRAAVEKTLQRFSGWVSSVPSAGSAATATELREAAKEIGKSVRQVKYEARRVAIDQGMKLSASVAHVVAKAEGAIACVWHDRGEHDASYDARPAHLKRTGTLFLVRDNWAMNEGLVAKRGFEYYDDLTDQAAVLPFCSCYVTWSTSIRDLPDTLLTAKGRESLRA